MNYSERTKHQMALDQRLKDMEQCLLRYGWQGFFEHMEGHDLIEIAHVYSKFSHGFPLTGHLLNHFGYE